MKNYINNTINIILLCSFLLLSCKDEIDVSEFTNIENDIVVNCILFPSISEITVFITETENAIGIIPRNKNELYFERIRNAMVQMSSENDTINIPFDTFDEEHENGNIGVFKADTSLFPIIAGKTYYLKIKLNNEKEITAQTTIPDAINSKSISSSYNNVSKRIIIQWKDPEESRDFYTISAEGRALNESNNNTSYTVDLEFSSEYLSDQSANETDGMLTVVSDSYETETFIGVNVSIVTLSIDYYEYFKTVGDEGFSFFPAPVALHTNIKGGVGVFGAYNITRSETDF